MGKSKPSLFQNLNYRQAIDFYKSQKGARHNLRIKILIFIVTVLLCNFFFFVRFTTQSDAALEFSTTPGYIWNNQTITADYSFPVYKDFVDYKNEQSKAHDDALPVFLFVDNAEMHFFRRMNILIAKLQDWTKKTEARKDTTKSTTKADKDASSLAFSEKTLKAFYDISSTSRQKEIANISRVIKVFMSEVYRFGFIDISSEVLKTHEVSLRKDPNLEKIFPRKNLTDSNTIHEKTKKFLPANLGKSSALIAEEIVLKSLFPNFVYSQELTSKAQILAEQSVSRYEDIVKKGETIISKGGIVNEKALSRLKSLERSRMMKNDVYYTFWSFVGSFGHATFIYLILILYLFFIRKQIFADNFKVGILSAMLVLVGLLSWLSVIIPTKMPIEYLVFIPAFSMIVAIVFDSRTAFYTTVTMALMLAGIRGNDYNAGVSLLFAGSLAAYTVRDIQSRTQMFQSIFYILIGSIFPILMIGLERSTDFTVLGNKIIMAGLNSILSPVISFGLLIPLEKWTSITTDLKLEEYDKLNHPLLVKLSELAPGTYQHVLALANIAERCAIVIDANPLLTKVGAYFHDVGKLNKPEYFAENQMEMENKHDLLTPKKSAEAIRQHVINGIKLAHEYKLPQRIIDFIPMHHGTTIIKHFYAKALEGAGTEPVNEEDFRYPGPKPFTKETAIVMICDSAEAMSRLVPNTKEDLDKMISGIIKDRVNDGQFEDCDITMKDFQLIKETCIKSLMGASHQRVKYKDLPEEKKEV